MKANPELKILLCKQEKEITLHILCKYLAKLLKFGDIVERIIAPKNYPKINVMGTFKGTRHMK